MIDDNLIVSFFFFNDTATTEIYTLSLHDALPIYSNCLPRGGPFEWRFPVNGGTKTSGVISILLCRSSRDRKSTRLNSSHGYISYAVFCLKKKKTNRMYQFFYFTAISVMHDLMR